MRYRTFRNLVVLVVAGALATPCLLVSLGVWVATKSDPDVGARPERDAWRRLSPDPAPPASPGTWDAEPAPPPPRSPVDPSRTTPSELDRRILALLGKPAEGDKLKDALGENGPKVNVYALSGATVWNHAKVDLDRDERWDEKWDWKDGKVSRKASPDDDEVYTLEFKLDGERWVSVETTPPPTPVSPAQEIRPVPVVPPTPAPALPPTPAPATSAPARARIALRDFDRKVVALLGKSAAGDKLKDALGKKGTKVNLYALAGSRVWNHAKVDLDRDDKWDEKWDWKDGKITRKVSPRDDEVYTQTFRLDGDAWVEEKN